MLLIMGLGTQMLAWHEDFCEQLAGRGYFVIRHDNRDIGRSTRLKHLGMPADTSYGQRDHINQEIAFAQSLFREHPQWPVIDITGKAVEESAADILRLKKDRDARKKAAASRGGAKKTSRSAARASGRSAKKTAKKKSSARRRA